LLGFAISLVSLLGKLEKVPFDIPEAETEVVAGGFTEYSGRMLAFLRMTLDVEMIAGSALLAVVFFPFGLDVFPIIGFLIFIVKVLVIVSLISLLRTIVARLRMDQMVNFCWKILVPLALLQLLLNLVLKGMFLK
jgi:NADH-quinone oxidoreductase subunit H